jgi:DnaJ domain
MPCVCAKCLRHCQTLGLEQEPGSRSVIHKAYRKAAKSWHPDRFEREPGKRQEAEEKFKLIQVAYNELMEHLHAPVETEIAKEEDASHKPPENMPVISFGGAPGCYVWPDFSMRAWEVIMQLGQELEQALAIVDLSGQATPQGSFAQYLLLTFNGIFVRDWRNRISLLWYHDLGDVRLVDRFSGRKSAILQKLAAKLSGNQPRLRLEIHRHDGDEFFAIAGEADDNVKKVLYRFLLKRKSELQQ